MKSSILSRLDPTPLLTQLIALIARLLRGRSS